MGRHGGVQGGGGGEQEQWAKVDSGETHTLTHTGKDRAATSAPPGGCRNIGERPASTRRFSPSRHEASAERGWAEAAGLRGEEGRRGQRAVGAHGKGKSGRRETGEIQPQRETEAQGTWEAREGNILAQQGKGGRGLVPMSLSRERLLTGLPWEPPAGFQKA